VSNHANSASASAAGSNHHAGFCNRSHNYTALQPRISSAAVIVNRTNAFNMHGY
jgi:hypothetical protein